MRGWQVARREGSALLLQLLLAVANDGKGACNAGAGWSRVRGAGGGTVGPPRCTYQKQVHLNDTRQQQYADAVAFRYVLLLYASLSLHHMPLRAIGSAMNARRATAWAALRTGSVLLCCR